MKKINLIGVGIALILFIVPFFWLPAGFVDLGGDAGRLYFLDPRATATNLYNHQGLFWAPSYSSVAYEFFLAFLHEFIPSSTHMIAFEHGVQLSLAFISIFLIFSKLLWLSRIKQDARVGWVGMVSGITYVGLITSLGWATSLPTLNQVFLNPLLFYFLLCYFSGGSFGYALAILLTTLLYSGNFGFSAMPQLLSFFPLAILFLLGVFRFLFHKALPWRKLLTLIVLFIGLHFFHILPTAATILLKETSQHQYIFNSESIKESGVHYFEVNHGALGKISTILFKPLILLIPGIIIFGFIKGKSKLLAILGCFFALTLFLTTANVTHFGVSVYRALFFIPGFVMFRSFNEKWYLVFAFFTALLFGAALYGLLKTKRIGIVISVVAVLIGVLFYGMAPFLRGKTIDSPHYQSNNVSHIFSMDPDLTDALSFVRTRPDGNFLTLPLTFPYYQIAYGKEGGAYVGISMLLHVAGRWDYPGFWRFGQYAQPMFDAIREENVNRILEILSDLNVRYVFYNSDTRIMDNFPEYPYIYPGLMYSSKDQLPAIRDQAAYKTFLSSLPLTKQYEKGFYSVYEIDYPNPPIFTSGIEIPDREKKYFFMGRIVSVLTLCLVILLSIHGFIRRKR